MAPIKLPLEQLYISLQSVLIIELVPWMKLSHILQ